MGLTRKYWNVRTDWGIKAEDVHRRIAVYNALADDLRKCNRCSFIFHKNELGLDNGCPSCGCLDAHGTEDGFPLGVLLDGAPVSGYVKFRVSELERETDDEQITTS